MDAYEIRKQEEKHFRPVKTISKWRKKIAEDTEAFLKSGGEITRLETNGRQMSGERVIFSEAAKLSGLPLADFMAANANGRYFGLPTPVPVGVKGRNYIFLKDEIQAFAKRVVEMKQGAA